MIKLEVEDNKFRVITQAFKISWLPDTIANRKVILIVLSNLKDENDKRIFKLRELAAILGHESAASANKHVATFRACGEEFDETLRLKYKVNGDVIKAVIEVLRENPMLSLEKIAHRTNEKMGREDISKNNIRKALKQISTTEIRRILQGQLSKGEIDYKEDYVFERLLELALENAESQKNEGSLPEHLEEHLRKTTKPLNSMPSLQKQGKPEEMSDDERNLFEGEVNSEKLSSIWNSPLGWKLWAFLLYFQGVSQSAIGGWMGVNKSTICRWLKDIADLGGIWLKAQKVASSAKVAVDEKWIKIAGKYWYLFVAVDCITGYPLYAAIYPRNDGNHCKLFLLELKNLGYRPKVPVVSCLSCFSWFILFPPV